MKIKRSGNLRQGRNLVRRDDGRQDQGLFNTNCHVCRSVHLGLFNSGSLDRDSAYLASPVSVAIELSHCEDLDPFFVRGAEHLEACDGRDKELPCRATSSMPTTR